MDLDNMKIQVGKVARVIVVVGVKENSEPHQDLGLEI